MESQPRIWSTVLRCEGSPCNMTLLPSCCARSPLLPAGPIRAREGTGALVERGWPETGRVTAHRIASDFAGFRFPLAVISLAVRWRLRYGLSYRDVEELLAECGIAVDHVTIYRWVQRFTPAFIEAARPCRHAPGDRWFADETYVKVVWRVDLALPGRRPVWPGHRRPAVGQA